MKIVIASDSYKGSLSSLEVGRACREGILRALPHADIAVKPMADGGEGTVTALADVMEGTWVKTTVHNPSGRLVDASYVVSADRKTAVIEMAEASGIQHSRCRPEDVLHASTFGTGEVILDALDRGVRSFIIGIGGSATNDAGTGMLKALGAEFLNAEGGTLAEGGAALQQLAAINVDHLDPRLAGCTFRIACDVDNPLTGSHGASAVYGPQKGAGEHETDLLDRALKQFADITAEAFNVDIDTPPGAGAAGGLGAAFLGFLPAALEKGAEIVADVTGLAEDLKDADLVITGEGGINHQTVHGKTPVYVASLAKRMNENVPVLALCGSIEPGYETVFDAGIDAVFSIADGPARLEELQEHAARNVTRTAENIARLWNCR
ncbi:glycerate kinase [Alkalicoccus urumqiensis]|uniref:Glycerate kinase n=1 Tax=Alkalicoccus urumqiensis TaxID=1548213 RepID=A0A2P6ME04_ALKUR|nr:glycerate kinase [Alkalicoccus urumqiensis]PRO64505.1 glycerate kinase [Alkalicoccus urumqiensis]